MKAKDLVSVWHLWRAHLLEELGEVPAGFGIAQNYVASYLEQLSDDLEAEMLEVKEGLASALLDDVRAAVHKLTERRGQLESKQEEQRSKQKSLVLLRDRMKEQSQIFDDEDLAEVQKCIEQVEKTIGDLDRDIAAQKNAQKEKEQLLGHLQGTIEKRTDLLDKADEDSSVLSDNEALLTYFAKKQLQLHEMLRQQLSAF